MASDNGDIFPERYEPLERIAETRLSAAWKVFDRERQVPVVLKRPRAAVLLNSEALQRFKTEVTLAARLSQSNIVPILDTHLAEPPYFFTMPLIEGEHLDHYCRTHELNIRERLELLLKVCRAITHAHQNGVIHRDLKPRNILVDAAGEPQVIDFGLGLRVDAPSVTGDARTLPVMGTPGYMAPEQAQGLPGDTRTDVYSLGVILYELVAGHLPIAPAAGWEEHLQRVCEQPPPSLDHAAPRTGRELAAVVMKTLRKEPAERYASVAEFAQDLANWLAHRPVTAVKPSAHYLTCKWVQRHWRAASVVSILAAGFVGLASLAIAARLDAIAREASALELGRHRAAVLNGRSAVNDGDPLNASRRLWQEHVRYNSRRTRFALWQFYRKYPCLFTNAEYGRQMQVRFDRSGRWLASVGYDQRLIVYDAETGKACQTIPANQARATCARYARHSNELLVAGSDGSVRTWSYDPHTGQLQPNPRTLPVSTAAITALALDDAEEQFATVSADGSVQVWRSAPDKSWRAMQEFQVGGRPTDLCFDPAGQRLACARLYSLRNLDGGVIVWSLVDGQVVYERDGQCRGVRFAHSGGTLLVADNDVCEIDLAEGTARKLPGRPGWGVRSLDTARPEGRPLVAYGCGDDRIVFVDAVTNQLLSIEGYHENSVADHIGVCFSPDGRRLASVGSDGLRMWDLSSALPRRAPAAGGRASRVLCLSTPVRAAQLLVTTYKDASFSTAKSGKTPCEPTSFVWLLAAHDTAPVQIASASPGEGFRQALSADGHQIAIAFNSASAARDQVCRVTLFDAAKPLAKVAEYFGAGDIRYMHWIDAGEPWLLFGVRKREDTFAPPQDTLYAWNVHGAIRGSPPQIVLPLEGDCTYLTSTPDGEWLAVSTERSADGELPGSVRIWRRAEAPSAQAADFDEVFQEVSHFRVHDYCWNVAFVRDGDERLLVATGGSVRDIYLWDALTGAPCGHLVGHRDCIHSCMALDEHILVSASRDGTVRIWDVPQREEVCLLHSGDSPFIDACNGHVVIVERDGFTVTSLSDLDRFIEGNREHETRRAARESASGGHARAWRLGHGTSPRLPASLALAGASLISQ